MRPIYSTSRWFAAAVCVLATTGVAAAQEGVVRVSDADSQPAVIKMNSGERNAPTVLQTAFSPGQSMALSGYGAYSPQQHFAAYAQYYGLEPTTPSQTGNSYQTIGGYVPGGLAEQQLRTVAYSSVAYSSGESCGGCATGGWGGACNADGGCCTSSVGTGNACSMNVCHTRQQIRKAQRCFEECDDCYYGNGYQRRVRLLAGALPKSSCDNSRYPCRWWRGQQANYHARNQRLSNCLFGWMVPSGCCGQGCPPFGKYHVTYADDPGYADSRDGQAYGAQGYGVPVTVPLAPNVRYSYNYSWGTPSSRLTPVGQYDPQTTPQSLYGQSW